MLKSVLSICCLVLLFAACDSPAPEHDDPAAQTSEPTIEYNPNKPTATPQFPLAPGATMESIRAQFSADQLKETEYSIGEGEMVDALEVFADTDSVITVVFDDGRAVSAIISGVDHPLSLHRLRTGMTIDDVEAINDGPFDISGLGWDYGGRVTDWKGGSLPEAVSATFIQRTRIVAPPELRGDQIVSSDNPAWENLGMIVETLRYNLREE